MPSFQDFEFRSSTAVNTIHARKCVPDGAPRAVVQIVHGIAEHIERYDDFMRFLAESGYACIIHDHRGHGESVKPDGVRGHFYTEDASGVVDDLHDVTEYAKKRFPGKPVYMFSHSMGTLVARNYLKKYDAELDKLVLSGPPTENKMAGVAVFLARVAGLFGGKDRPNTLLHKLTFGKGYDAGNAWLSENAENVQRYNSDPLCGFVFTTNGFLNLYKLQKGAFSLKDWTVRNPGLEIMLMAGADDPVIQGREKFAALEQFLRRAGYENVRSRLYENARHEILNETRKEEIYGDVLAFYEGR